MRRGWQRRSLTNIPTRGRVGWHLKGALGDADPALVISAVLSLSLGVLAWVGTVPATLPAIGLALGANAALKNRAGEGSESAFWVGALGLLASGSAIAVVLLP